jgi:hypothetical protein
VESHGAAKSVRAFTLKVFAADLEHTRGLVRPTSRIAAEHTLALGAARWHTAKVLTDPESLASALTLPESDLVKLEDELLASVAPDEAVSAPAWESGWLAEVAQCEALEPDESLRVEHELPAVRQRLLGLFR